MNAYSPRRFFLLWAAGLIAQSVLMRIVWIAFGAGTTTLYSQVQVITLAIAVVGHGWQAWLLFRPGWRFAVWTALPLLSLIAPNSVRWLQMLGIIAPLIETACLAGVRLRPWAWLLAGMGQVVLSSLAPFIVNLANAAARQFPALASQISPSMFSGIWLLGELAAGAVLAWWMPPLTPGSRTTSPPPPGSTDA